MNEIPATGFENVEFDLRAVPIDKIRLGKYSLRDVDRNSEEYMRFRDSIASTNGPMTAISVRIIEDPENPGEEAFNLVDGLQRFSACSDLQFKTIPARVMTMEAAEIAAAQIIANNSRINTKPVEYTQQLRRMFMSDPTLTLEELSDKLHCTVKWLQDRLSLAKLHPDLGPLVDEGKIPLAQAFALAKLQPKEEQLAYSETAQTQNIQEFAGHVAQRVKALKDALRAGRDAPDKTWQPVAFMRPVKELKEQLESPTIAEVICSDLKATTPEAGFLAALKWVFNLDPMTVKVLKAKAEDKEKADKEKKDKLAREKADKKADAARASLLGIPVEDLVKDESLVAVGGGDEEEDDEDDE